MSFLFALIFATLAVMGLAEGLDVGSVLFFGLLFAFPLVVFPGLVLLVAVEVVGGRNRRAARALAVTVTVGLFVALIGERLIAYLTGAVDSPSGALEMVATAPLAAYGPLLRIPGEVPSRASVIAALAGALAGVVALAAAVAAVMLSGG